MRETIDENTVGDLDGARVPMASMGVGAYDLPDGSAARGLRGALALPDGSSVFVGLGSEVVVDGLRWRVVDIEKDAGEPGSVTLEAAAGNAGQG